MEKCIELEIINLEKAALEKWNNGNPSGYLDIYANDIVYFDPFTELRVNGLNKITEIYERLRGLIYVNSYEMIDPKVQASEKMAVLTFNLVSYTKFSSQKWNCTEVFQLFDDGCWKIIQSHWSFTTPDIK